MSSPNYFTLEDEGSIVLRNGEKNTQLDSITYEKTRQKIEPGLLTAGSTADSWEG